MLRQVKAACAAALVLAGAACCRNTADVVPLPQASSVRCGEYILTADTPVYAWPESRGMSFAVSEMDALRTMLFGAEGFSEAVFTEESSAGTPCVRMSVDESLGRESYRLDISRRGIEMTGGDPAGLFYAVQTLRQLVPEQSYRSAGTDGAKVSLPAVLISDGPALEYRGIMLDAARHFFPKGDVKRLIDIMALHKMNVFHWHLTDDQGWRISIDSHPELTETGSVRLRTIIGKDPGGEYDETTRYDETPHGGYYTKDDIREIVAYAESKFITVIPEIEFPGHAVAAIASLPYLGCTGERYEVRQTWDIDDRVFCLGRESTFAFFEDVLAEVAELFPSEYIHLGGDECPTVMWENCPYCRKRMEEENLGSFRALQGYGMKRLEKYLASLGRSVIGWDEILEAGVDHSAVVMSWRGRENALRAAENGNRVIMSPTEYSYFDYYQTEDTENEPLAWGGYIPLYKVFSFDPYDGLDSSVRHFVIGVQANLWTEYIPDFSHAEYMLLPRLGAMSEVAWRGGTDGDYDGFLGRMRAFSVIYDISGYNCRSAALFED